MMHGKSVALLLLGVVLLVTVVPFVWASSGEHSVNQACSPTPGGPPCNPEGESEPPSDWVGFTDGRLNPAIDEYYTVYCLNDSLHVWGDAPRETFIPILLILTGPFPADGGNGLTVNRAHDTITISGANGYGPNHPGEKSFSLSECLDRNGRVPVAPSEPEPSVCDWAFFVEHMPQCLRALGFNDLGILIIQLFFQCSSVPVTFSLIFTGVAFRSRRLRRRRKSENSRQ